jgi:hypothetical protein
MFAYFILENTMVHTKVTPRKTKEVHIEEHETIWIV